MAADIGVHDASVEVASDQPVIAERSMYTHAAWPGSGTSLRECQCSTGVVAPATDFFLAEGSTAWGFETYVLVQNPGDKPNSIRLDALTDGHGVVEATMAMPANSRRTVRMSEIVREPVDFSVAVHGELPIVVERAMYWGCGTSPGLATHDSIGVAAPHLTRLLPAGGALGGKSAETYTCVANPNPGAVEVEVSYLTPTGKGNVTFADEIAPGSRKTYRMGALLKGAASVIVTSRDSTRPIVVERSMYFDGKFAGTNSMGAFTD